MSLFDTAKQADILALARQAGYNPKKAGGGRYAILCPVHSEKTPSCHLHTAGKFRNRVHCHGCGFDGSVVDFWAAVRGIGEVEAARELAAQMGGDIPLSPARPAPVEVEVETQPGEHSALYAAFLEWCKGYGASPQKYAVRDYLAGRGIDAAATRAGRLSAVPCDRAALAWLRVQEGAEAAGLLRKGRFTLSGYPLLLPSYSPCGRVMALQGRQIGPGPGPKYKYLAGVQKYPYGAHSLHISGPLAIVEGAIDALAVIAGGGAAIALGGISFPRVAAEMVRGRGVLLSPDADKAGDLAYPTLKAAVEAAGAAWVRRARPRGGAKDAGEVLQNTPAGQLAAMATKNPVLGALLNTFSLKITKDE